MTFNDFFLLDFYQFLNEFGFVLPIHTREVDLAHAYTYQKAVVKVHVLLNGFDVVHCIQAELYKDDCKGVLLTTLIHISSIMISKGQI